ncbi:MAG: ArnT family glycosyltransferase [Desulforhopalus sp.]
MDPQKSANWWQWLILMTAVVISSILLRPPIPIDETRYLSVAWEMWQSNNFLVPHINGQPYSHKPPLLFWLIHASWLLFGVNEWSARMVSPLFGLGSVILTVRLVKKLWPEDRSTHAATPFILVGTLIWIVFSSLTMFDTLLTFFSLLALDGVLSATRTFTIFPWVRLGLATGLGILAKGPIIFLYTLPAILFGPWWSEKRSFSWLRWYGCSLLAVTVGIGVALCWAVPAGKAGGEQYSQAIFFSQTAGRMVQAFAHARPFYWYMLLIPLILFPWIFFLPAWRGWKKFTSDNSTRFCLCTVAGCLLLLSSVSGKQLHYVVPLLPLIAMLLARIIFSAPRIGKLDYLPLVLLYLFLSLLLLVLPYLAFSDGKRDILDHLPKWIAGAPLASAFFLVFFWPSSLLGRIKAISGSIIALVILFNVAAYGPLHAMYDQSTIGNKIGRIQQQGGQVAVFPSELATQFQFAGRLTKPLVVQRIAIGEMALWSERHPEQFCMIFTKSPEYEQLVGSGTVQRYNNGLLIFRPARDFVASYQNWVALSRKNNRF